MVKEFNALKRTNYKLEDFCLSDEIEKLKNFLDREGRPLDSLPLTIYGEPTSVEEHMRNDRQFRIRIFDGRVLNSDVYRNNDERLNENNVADDLVYSGYVEDYERF